MKELSIKEKAKRYDEAIEIARQIHDADRVSGIELTTCEEIFPELAEPDDERIRKALKEYFINSFQNNGVAAILGVHIKDILAWLEKQAQKPAFEMKSPEESLGIDSDTYNNIVDECIYGKHKPADKVEPKFKIGDKVHLINGSSPNYEDDCIVISDISNNTYYGNWEGGYFAIKDQDKYELVEQKPAWSEEDEKLVKNLISTLSNLYARNLIEKETKEKYTNLLKSFKDRVQPQPKSDWGEEDEKMLQNILECMKKGWRKLPTDILKYESWLKSLRPQNIWKPSDEQMEALKEACDEHWEPDGLDPLYTLYQDLKKLKE